MPSLRRPARASTAASNSPASTLSMRVSTLPRIGRTSRSGRTSRTWASRRGELVPTLAPRGRPGGKAVEAARVAADERITGIFAHGYGRDDESFGPPGRQVFVAMDGDVDL